MVRGAAPSLAVLAEHLNQGAVLGMVEVVVYVLLREPDLLNESKGLHAGPLQ